MRVDSIAQYIANKGIGVIGTNIFAYYMPAISKTGVLILPRVGNTTRSVTQPGWVYRDGFQVIVRSPKFASALKMARSIDDVLNQRIDFTLPAVDDLPEYHVKAIYPLADPIPYTRDDAAVWEVSVNYQISFVEGDAS